MRYGVRAGLLGALLASGLWMITARVLVGQSASPPGVKTYVGETRAVGEGIARTWFTTDARGTPLAIGVVLNSDALDGLPEEVTEYPLAFPPEARVTAFNHFTFDWRPHGHIPPGIYNVPHFDLHFYLITRAERERITADARDRDALERQPRAEEIPSGYVLAPGSGEPRMGMHWIDPTAPEFHGHPFTETMIYGFYNGRLIFFEPMVTRDFLLTHTPVRRTLKLPQAYPKSGYYPTS
jgi:hypothetical protein